MPRHSLRPNSEKQTEQPGKAMSNAATETVKTETETVNPIAGLIPLSSGRMIAHVAEGNNTQRAFPTTGPDEMTAEEWNEYVAIMVRDLGKKGYRPAAPARPWFSKGGQK